MSQETIKFSSMGPEDKTNSVPTTFPTESRLPFAVCRSHFRCLRPITVTQATAAAKAQLSSNFFSPALSGPRAGQTRDENILSIEGSNSDLWMPFLP